MDTEISRFLTQNFPSLAHIATGRRLPEAMHLSTMTQRLIRLWPINASLSPSGDSPEIGSPGAPPVTIATKATM
jgi:hypothetical protein